MMMHQQQWRLDFSCLTEDNHTRKHAARVRQIAIKNAFNKCIKRRSRQRKTATPDNNFQRDWTRLRLWKRRGSRQFTQKDRLGDFWSKTSQKAQENETQVNVLTLYWCRRLEATGGEADNAHPLDQVGNGSCALLSLLRHGGFFFRLMFGLLDFFAVLYFLNNSK